MMTYEMLVEGGILTKKILEVINIVDIENIIFFIAEADYEILCLINDVLNNDYKSTLIDCIFSKNIIKAFEKIDDFLIAKGYEKFDFFIASTFSEIGDVNDEEYNERERQLETAEEIVECFRRTIEKSLKEIF